MPGIVAGHTADFAALGAGLGFHHIVDRAVGEGDRVFGLHLAREGECPATLRIGGVVAHILALAKTQRAAPELRERAGQSGVHFRAIRQRVDERLLSERHGRATGRGGFREQAAYQDENEGHGVLRVALTGMSDKTIYRKNGRLSRISLLG